MKILFVISTYGPSGAGSGISVQNLAEGCAARGHETVVLCLLKDPDAEPFEETQNGVRVIHRKIRNLYPLGVKNNPKWRKLLWHLLDIYNPFAAWDTYKILKSEKPDVVNTSVIAGFSTSIHWIARLLKIPTIHTMRDYYLMCKQNAMYPNGKTCETICASCQPFLKTRVITSNYVSLFLANSQYVLDQHIKHKALPPNVPSFAQFNMNAGNEIDKARKFPKNRPLRFGFIGRLAPSKGLENLIKAFAIADTKNAELKIGGYGQENYVEQLKEQAKGLNIEFLGRVKAQEFYRDIDVLICPSVYGEPLPRVVYEGYRYALPVIASNAGGTPEIVDEGKTGFVYPADDTNVLAKYIEDILNDATLYTTLSKGAVRKAKDFTQDVILDQFFRHVKNVTQKDAA